jgi:hypothetical protein
VQKEGHIRKEETQNHITGDSHARNSALEIRHDLDTSFEVQEFVKPGTRVATVTNTTKDDTEKLTKRTQ